MEQTTSMEAIETQLSPREEKFISASAVGLIFSLLTITVLIFVADLHLVFKDWLKLTFSHHWIGKGILGSIAFVVPFIVTFFATSLHRHAKNFLSLSLWTSALCTIAVTGFFVYEVFIK